MKKEEDCLNSIILSDLYSLDAYDASIAILEKLKFLDRNSHDYKFKEIANQVVIETKDYYYKIYIDFIENGKYLLEMRKKLADIYERYGVHWKIFYSYCDGRIVTIEQREKLRLCGYDITCVELLENWKHTINLLKKELNFDDLLLQIKEKEKGTEFDKAIDLLILRESLTKVIDYAYAPNGNVILLDDNDFFISAVYENGELVARKDIDIDIMTTCGIMRFCSQKEHWENRIKSKFDLSKRYFIMDKSCNKQSDEVFIPNDLDTIKRELKIFSTNMPANSSYQNEYRDNYIKKHSIELKKSENLRLK